MWLGSSQLTLSGNTLSGLEERERVGEREKERKVERCRELEREKERVVERAGKYEREVERGRERDRER